MKLLVKCSLGAPADGLKELVIRNPTATLSNVRAAIAINFRLPVHSFRMIHSTTDLSDEKHLLHTSGVKDGDIITVVSKRDREEGTTEAEAEEQARVPPADLPEAKEKSTAENKDKDEGTAAKEKEEKEKEEEEESDEDDEEVEDDEEGDAEGDAADGMTELLSHLLSTVPNLVEMRRQFLENPEEIMRQIQERDPHLFELIAANHQEFLGLVNNEALVETLQLEQEAADEEEDYGDEEGELDEEGEEALQRMLLQYLAGGAGDGGDTNAGEESAGSETQRYLERVPTAEDETKIEQLMQLGFTREQCQVAYFKSNRSLERAANLLFEDPPQL